MGKRTKNLSGLSHFAKQAFRQNSAPDSSSNAAGASSSQYDVVTATEKPQIESLGSPWHAYEATGLVPHYKTASEVPEHLQKCTVPLR
jgi:trimethylguanosine synthase